MKIGKREESRGTAGGPKLQGEHATPPDWGKGYTDVPPEMAQWMENVNRRLSEIYTAVLAIQSGSKVPQESKSAQTRKTPEYIEEMKARGVPIELPKTENGHPILGNGKKAPWVEVPSTEAVLVAAKKYLDKHGDNSKAYLKGLLTRFKVEKVRDLADEHKALFLEALDENPETP